jgi:hypothetical protein
MTWRVLASVFLLLVCGPVAAEDVSPTSKSGISKDITSIPKRPPAKELFGAVAAPAPWLLAPLGPMRGVVSLALYPFPSTVRTGR